MYEGFLPWLLFIFESFYFLNLEMLKQNAPKKAQKRKTPLTLIRMAGGVYDCRNFEQKLFKITWS